MWLSAALLVAAAMPAQQEQTDTVIAVKAGTKLEIENYGGETVVSTWDRSAIRVQAEHGVRDRVEIRLLGAVITVRSQSRMGPPRGVDYRITVPVQTDLRITGVYQDVSVEGVQGSVDVGTVNGDLTLRGGDGFVSLKSVEGDVRVTGAKAKMVLESINADVYVETSQGDIQATSTNGDVDLIAVTSANVSAATVNGDVLYDGPIQDAGHYDFSTHNGDITVTVPENANATVSVETFSGEFESAYPVRLTQSRKNRFTFVLGTGSGRLNLESFQGTIRLARPGELRRPRGQNRGRGAGAGGVDLDLKFKFGHDFKFDFDHDFKFDFDFLRDLKVDVDLDLRHLKVDLQHLKYDLKRDLKDWKP